MKLQNWRKPALKWREQPSGRDGRLTPMTFAAMRNVFLK
jgi:hypothetical protein